MWELDDEESWALNNWCFWTVVLKKTLESPLNCKEIQSVLSKGDQSCAFIEGLILKLKLQYFGHLMWRVDSLEKTLVLGGLGAGGEGEDRGWDAWMASPTQWTWVWMNSGIWWWTGRPGVLQFMGSQRVRHDWATELNWIAFSKSVLNIWKFMVHVLLKPGLENFDHYFTSVWNEFNCAVVWTFFSIAFLWDWNENWPFPVLSRP